MHGEGAATLGRQQSGVGQAAGRLAMPGPYVCPQRTHALLFCAMTANRLLKRSSATPLLVPLPRGRARSVNSWSKSCSPA